jgi:hypothetical protein
MEKTSAPILAIAIAVFASEIASVIAAGPVTPRMRKPFSNAGLVELRACINATSIRLFIPELPNHSRGDNSESH